MFLLSDLFRDYLIVFLEASFIALGLLFAYVLVRHAVASCSECGATLSCPNCSVTLTFHRSRSQSVCHYCDYAVPAPGTCPSWAR